MLTLASIVARVLVAPFYKANTGFFLFLFFVLFGLMNARDLVLYHSSLMYTIVSTGAGLVVGMVVYLFYNYKCAAFVLNSFARSENYFLVDLQALPVLQQLGVFTVSQFLLLLPVLLYFGVTIAIGLLHSFIVTSFALLLYLVLLLVGSAGLYYYRLNRYHKPAIKLPLPTLGSYTKLPVLYTLHYLLHERKLALVAVKLFSGLVFYLVFVINYEGFSLNYFRLLFLLCTAAHSMLVYYSFRFTEQQLAFTRSLPITRAKRLFAYLLTFLLLLLPELCWLLVYSGSLMSWPELLLTFCIGLGHLLLLSSILYLPNMSLQHFGLTTCLVYMGLAMLLPSGVAIVLAAEITIALLIFYTRYYKFELAINE